MASHSWWLMSSWWSQWPGWMKLKPKKMVTCLGPSGTIRIHGAWLWSSSLERNELHQAFFCPRHTHDSWQRKAQTYRIGQSRVQQWLCRLFISTWSSDSNGTISSCAFKAWTDLERQNHLAPDKDETYAFICHISLPVWLRDMDTDSGTGKENSVHRMRCYGRILNITYKDHITNEEVHSCVYALIGSYEELLTTVKKRKLRWYGHVFLSSDLTKTITPGNSWWNKKACETKEEMGR